MDIGSSSSWIRPADPDVAEIWPSLPIRLCEIRLSTEPLGNEQALEYHLT